MTPSLRVPPPTGRLGLVEFVEPTVLAIVADRLGVEPALLRPHVSLMDDLAADSLDVLEVVIDVESVFAICIPEREVDCLRSITDLVHVVAKYLWERDHPEPFDPFHVAVAA